MTTPARVTVKCDCGREVVVNAYVSPLADDERAMRTKAAEIVETHPLELTKSQLASRLGARRSRAIEIVARLIADGVIGPDRPKAKLHLRSALPEGRTLESGRPVGSEVA